MRKLYVGNLPYEITEDEVSQAFNQYGSATSVKLISDRETGRGKGFGFVEMENAEQAQAVVEELNGREVFGRTLKVDIARERPQRNGAGGFNRGPRDGGRERNFNR